MTVAAAMGVAAMMVAAAQVEAMTVAAAMTTNRRLGLRRTRHEVTFGVQGLTP